MPCRERGFGNIDVKVSPLFKCENEPFGPAHVLAAAAFWGELAPLADAVRRRLAIVARARAAGVAVEDEVLQAASEGFRRDRELRTARATSAWLKARCVSLEAFTDYLEGEYLEGIPGAPEAVVAADTDDDGLAAALWPHAVFSGVADAWIHRLTARVAIAREEAGEAGIPPSIFDTGGEAVSLPEDLALWIKRLGLPHNWREELRNLEAAHRRFSLAALTGDRMDRVLRKRWEVLFALDVELCGFPNEAAAREGCLCVTEDGVAMDGVAALAGGSYWEGRLLLGDLPENLRAKALSAREEALLPVFEWNGQHVVCRVRAKFEPSVTDTQTRGIVEGVVLEEMAAPLIKRHITWPAGAAI